MGLTRGLGQVLTIPSVLSLIYLYIRPVLHPVSGDVETSSNGLEYSDMLALRAWPPGRIAALGVQLYQTQDTSRSV